MKTTKTLLPLLVCTGLMSVAASAFAAEPSTAAICQAAAKAPQVCSADKQQVEAWAAVFEVTHDRKDAGRHALAQAARLNCEDAFVAQCSAAGTQQ